MYSPGRPPDGGLAPSGSGLTELFSLLQHIEAQTMALSSHAVILAAGRGSRLGDVTDHRPKALLSIGPLSINESLEVSFLERQVRLLREMEIDRILVVAGYRYELVEETIRSWDLGVELVLNPTPDIGLSGSLHSFQFAQREAPGVLDGTSQTLLMDADIVYHRDILRHFLEAPPDTSLLVCDRHELSQEEVLVYGTNIAPRFIAKGLTAELAGGEPCLGEAVGIVKFGPAEHRLVRKVTDWLVGDPASREGSLAHRGFGPARQATEHEELTQHLMHCGRIRAITFSGENFPFMEVDHPAEYMVLRSRLYPDLLRLEAL